MTQAVSLGNDFLCFCDYLVLLQNVAACFPEEPGACPLTIWSGTSATPKNHRWGEFLLSAVQKLPSLLVFQPEPRC